MHSAACGNAAMASACSSVRRWRQDAKFIAAQAGQIIMRRQLLLQRAGGLGSRASPAAWPQVSFTVLD